MQGHSGTHERVCVCAYAYGFVGSSHYSRRLGRRWAHQIAFGPEGRHAPQHGLGTNMGDRKCNGTSESEAEWSGYSRGKGDALQWIKCSKHSETVCAFYLCAMARHYVLGTYDV